MTEALYHVGVMTEALYHLGVMPELSKCGSA